MLGCSVQFSDIPTIGFAHHFYVTKEYQFRYHSKKSIEIAYIKSGEVTVELYGHRFQAPPNSFLILFHHLPIHLYASKNEPQAHCCLELIVDYDFHLLEKATDYQAKSSGLLLPFITPQCQETEELKKILYAAVSDLSISRQEHSFCAALAGLSILQSLSRLYRKQVHAGQSSASLLQYQVKQYVANHLSEELALSEIAQHLHRTPNYINHVFKEECGITIHQYINKERVRLLGELLQTQSISFQSACAQLGIEDVSYGYRLFKRHMGMTPKEYLEGKQYPCL